MLGEKRQKYRLRNLLRACPRGCKLKLNIMALLKLIGVVAFLLGIVIIGLSLKTIIKPRKPGCNDSDIGYSCGCGGGTNCSTDAASKGI